MLNIETGVETVFQSIEGAIPHSIKHVSSAFACSICYTHVYLFIHMCFCFPTLACLAHHHFTASAAHCSAVTALCHIVHILGVLHSSLITTWLQPHYRRPLQINMSPIWGNKEKELVMHMPLWSSNTSQVTLTHSCMFSKIASLCQLVPAAPGLRR